MFKSKRVSKIEQARVKKSKKAQVKAKETNKF